MICEVVNCYLAAAVAQTDTYFTSTVLLLSCDGANGSTTFTDESHAARGNAGVNNDAQVVTAIKKFGTGSLRCDGGIDNITFADSADWNFTGDFTVELWGYFDATYIENAQALISQYDTTGNQRSWLFDYLGSAATNILRFVISSNGSSASVLLSANWTPTADTWYHLAVDRSGNTWRMYIDGVCVASVSSASALFNSTSGLRMGAVFSGSLTEYLKGNLDEIRVTKGVARYATDTNFSVPTTAFPRS